METDQDRLVERRRHLVAVAADFRVHDQAALAHLPAAQVRDQAIARRLLRDHVRAVWDRAHAHGLNPAIAPQWLSVGMLCDLTAHLTATVTELPHRRHR